MRMREWLCSSVSLRSRALEQADEAMALWLTARDVLVNICIIVCLCNIVEVWQGPDFFFDNATVGSFLTRRAFNPSNGTSREDDMRIGLLPPDFTEIATLQMVWDWMDARILPTFAVAEPRVLISNRLLGRVRLRQVRVRDGTCVMQEVFGGVFAECFGPYSDANENKGSFGPGSGTAWEWNSPQSLGGDAFVGEVGTYGGGGFYVDLPRDQRAASAVLRELRDQRWLDEATRMLFVDINLYNPNHNVFVLVNLFVEIPPTAGLLPRSHVNSLKLLNDHPYDVTWYVLLLACSLWTGVLQAAELAWRGLWSYIGVIAHYLHFLGAVLGVVVSVIGIVKTCVDSEPALRALQSEGFVDLLDQRYRYDAFRSAVILTLFVTCGRLLFLSDFGPHSKLSATLHRSLPSMLSFSFMFAILLCSFSMLAYLVFGAELYAFRTFRSSLFVLVEVIVGQLDYKSLVTVNRFLGPLFYIAFIFFVVFVLYNMFIVILNDTYYGVREKAADEPPKFQVVPFVSHCLANLLKCLRISPSARPRQPAGKVIRLRALRTMLHLCNVPRAAVNDFIWRCSLGGREAGLIGKEEAARMAEDVAESLWQEPASWEHFMSLWQRLSGVERGVDALDQALDELLADLR